MLQQMRVKYTLAERSAIFQNCAALSEDEKILEQKLHLFDLCDDVDILPQVFCGILQLNLRYSQHCIQ